jgi:hypothetical protein
MTQHARRDARERQWRQAVQHKMGVSNPAKLAGRVGPVLSLLLGFAEV